VLVHWLLFSHTHLALDFANYRLWVKCGTAACGMRKVKRGMECAARRLTHFRISQINHNQHSDIGRVNEES